MPNEQFESNKSQDQEQLQAASKRTYQTPQLEDYGSVSIRTQNQYGLGKDGGPINYNYGPPPYSN